ncbi:MAG: DUF58 domain-containing protein [Gammaproteobacteria bacterium]|nr:DUF58 domain-containing protein [Gammaproteobacteria bacterium]
MRTSAYSVLSAIVITLFAIATVFLPELVKTFQITVCLFIAICLFDFIGLRQLVDIKVTRQVNKNIPIYSWTEVTLRIQHNYNSTLQLAVHDYHPSHFLVQGQPHTFSLPPKLVSEIRYRVKPLQRGDAQFSGIDLLITSPFRLWKKRLHLQLDDQVHVYPNFSEIVHFALLAIDNHLSQMGVRRRQRRGEGQDFLQLREYRFGDSIKQIDWKATSRYQKLISREYQDERDQQIIFLIDCGRRMRHVENGQAHLDQALNAMLLLSYVAIRQGDAAGFLSFAGTERWVPPRKGAHVVNSLLNQAYDLPSTTETADYIGVANKLVGLQRKRAMVVILTNTRDEDQTDLKKAAKLLSRRHLVVLADLREPELNEASENPVTDLDSALLFHGVMDYLHRRKQEHEILQHAGAICIDTTAEELPVRLINQYLAIKRSGKL